MIRQSHPLLSALILATVILSACQPSTPPVDINAQLTQAVQTAFASIQQTQIASIPSATNTPSATATLPPRTPPALPSTFVAASLNPLDAPHTYIQDSCQYLKDKWTSTNSTPGTIVMVVMIHSIIKGTITDPLSQISVQDFNQLVNDLHDQGFTAINTQQLADFLYTNAKIPQRSVVLIQDDRKTAENFNDHFLPYYEKWGWPVVNAWISSDDSITKQYLSGNVELEREGWVDHQAHGVIHNVPMSDNSTDDYIRGELQGSIDFFQNNFGKTPIAIIWPGGGFGVRPVQMARKLGYKLGFTTSPRGPLMFNWIPQQDQNDPQNPWYIAEGPSGDPLMTLPRYFDNNAGSHIDEVRRIGNAATAYAEQNKATELEYYDIMCAPAYGPIP